MKFEDFPTFTYRMLYGELLNKRQVLDKVLPSINKPVSFDTLYLCSNHWYNEGDGMQHLTPQELKQELGRLLIEKKIDYTREGLWAPIK